MALVDERIGWLAVEEKLRAGKELTRLSEHGRDEVVERYPAVRRFLPTFLAAFRFQTARAGDPLFGAVELLRTFYSYGRRLLPREAPVSFLKPRWRRIVTPTDGAFNWRAWEIAALVNPINRDAFVVYVRQVLVHELSPDDTVIMRNRHKAPAARDAIGAAGAKLLFLPLYSSDFKPIEQAFSKLKAHLRKAAERTIHGLWYAIGRTLGLYPPQECANYLANAGSDAD